MTDASRSDAAALVEAGGDRGRRRGRHGAASKLPLGQVIEIDESGCRRRSCRPPIRAIDVPVVFADEDVVVIDKPAGLVVHPGHGHPDGTLVNAMLATYPEIAEIGEPIALASCTASTSARAG